MQNTTQNIWVGVDPAKQGSECSITQMSVESMELMLNEARMDERRNQAVIVSNYMETIAAKILNREMNCKEAAELLYQVAERMINQSHEQH
ncbi:TPA: DUF2732 family protein [Yersinia enterocolitica]|uniref:DUF2732 family protein n=1 Tax=Yersinia enterocolitica TaxID=630 RepID=UPI0005E4E34C|nr:DUF2732 family protein [Yersinia enterocolitica]EKN3332164.1 DUF2732 family protein [Yersinia enterocolitica]EKN3764445.1 DUF2732 family protein [Yersinia enterocolitica]EKN5122782.1 DUF2732 family protein [Yersinia enterocolitica]EKN6133723.1 DUF2732 family protein [Yersinia enterocolitica]CNJ62045.1 Protein of uncharacterised function (DUF2732) [Yersinia enterocolitica]